MNETVRSPRLASTYSNVVTDARAHYLRAVLSQDVSLRCTDREPRSSRARKLSHRARSREFAWTPRYLQRVYPRKNSVHDDDTCTIMHASIMSKHRPLGFLRTSDRSCDSERNELGGASESEFSLDISLDRNGARSDRLRIGFPRAIRGDRRFPDSTIVAFRSSPREETRSFICTLLSRTRRIGELMTLTWARDASKFAITQLTVSKILAPELQLVIGVTRASRTRARNKYGISPPPPLLLFPSLPCRGQCTPARIPNRGATEMGHTTMRVLFCARACKRRAQMQISVRTRCNPTTHKMRHRYFPAYRGLTRSNNGRADAFNCSRN